MKKVQIDGDSLDAAVKAPQLISEIKELGGHGTFYWVNVTALIGGSEIAIRWGEEECEASVRFLYPAICAEVLRFGVDANAGGFKDAVSTRFPDLFARLNEETTKAGYTLWELGSHAMAFRAAPRRIGPSEMLQKLTADIPSLKAAFRAMTDHIERKRRPDKT